MFIAHVFNLTPASGAVHVGADCMIKYEGRVFMQFDTVCAVALHALVMHFSLTKWLPPLLNE